MKVEELSRDEETGFGRIKCSKCLLEEKYPAGPLTDPVDIYGQLIDDFYGADSSERIEQEHVKQLSLGDLKKEGDKEEEPQN